jgi:hypothetical protein
MYEESEKQDRGGTPAPFSMEPTSWAIGYRSITDVHGRPTSMPHTAWSCRKKGEEMGMGVNDRKLNMVSISDVGMNLDDNAHCVVAQRWHRLRSSSNF